MSSRQVTDFVETSLRYWKLKQLRTCKREQTRNNSVFYNLTDFKKEGSSLFDEMFTFYITI